jgi:predicted Rossmann-fold nucleotide-binding protein
MSVSPHGLFGGHRIGVCGSSNVLEPGTTRFCTSLGHCLAEQRNITIVAGSTKERGADATIVNAAAPQMSAEQRVEQIEWYAETKQTDLPGVGTFRKAEGQTSEARRISFVLSVDALIAVAGGKGTSQELALALEFGIKVLPVPAFDRAAGSFWNAYRSRIIESLGIDGPTAARWEKRASYRDDGCEAVAREMVTSLVASLPRRCFVMMPFGTNLMWLYEEVVKPVVEASRDRAIRLDQEPTVGSAHESIALEIRSCDYAIAVLDGFSPNVMYEVGMAHALGKPVILIAEQAIKDKEVPFNITHQQRIHYINTGREQLRARLKDSIREVGNPVALKLAQIKSRQTSSDVNDHSFRPHRDG